MPGMAVPSVCVCACHLCVCVCVFVCVCVCTRAIDLVVLVMYPLLLSFIPSFLSSYLPGTVRGSAGTFAVNNYLDLGAGILVGLYRDLELPRIVTS